MQSITSKIIQITSDVPGPTLAIFAGVHGNETAGILALQELIPTLNVTRGKLLLAFANPPAIESNVRMLNKNLNRSFFKDNDGTEPEDKRARELMKVLDVSDALLDLHMFRDDTGLPFVICEEGAVDLAEKLNVDIISINWDKVEPGATDWYMYKRGKIGVCVECGPISKAPEYKDFAVKTVYQFLKYFNMTDKDVVFSKQPKRIIKAKYAMHKTSENLRVTEGLHNFDILKKGQVIATEKDKVFTANEDECIIFPNYNARIGEEAYIIGNEIT